MGLKNLIKGQLLSSISYRSSDPQELAAVMTETDAGLCMNLF